MLYDKQGQTYTIMNQEHVTLLRDFYYRCYAHGTFHFAINGKGYLLEFESDAETIVQAIIAAPGNIQNYRIRQAVTQIDNLPMIRPVYESAA